jgi:hypothetical protein
MFWQRWCEGIPTLAMPVGGETSDGRLPSCLRAVRILAVGTVALLGPSVPNAAIAGQAQPGGMLWVAATAGTVGAAIVACPVQGILPLEDQGQAMRTAFRAVAMLATPGYALLKLGIAVGLTGVAAGTLALTFDPDVAVDPLHAGWAGDWWLAPQHVSCEEPVHLVATRAR